jgi:hypothetical protein
MKSPADAGTVSVGTMKGALSPKKRTNATSRRMAGPFSAPRSQIRPPTHATAKIKSGGMSPANTLMTTTITIEAIVLQRRKRSQLKD